MFRPQPIVTSVTCHFDRSQDSLEKAKVSGAPFKGSKAGWMMDHGRMCSSSSDPSMIHPSITADACRPEPDRTGRELLLPDALSRPGRRRDARETRREETHGRLPAACLMNPWQIRDRRSVQFTWREAVGGDNNFGWSRGRRRAAAAVTSSSHSPPPPPPVAIGPPDGAA